MIIDTTLFNNEFDMLDIHLAITSNYVDRWIILEASRTFSGLEKPYYLTERLAEYRACWGDRIETVCLPLSESETNLVCETRMRQGFRQSLAHCDPNDIVIHGDLDEIINPESWNQILALMDQHDQAVTCGMEMFFYRLDQQAGRNWKGSVVARRRMFDTPHELYKGQNVKRKDRSHCVGLKQPVGWHWTWMGSDEAIRHKVRACIESQHRDPDQVLRAFQDLDTVSAINHKCASQVVSTQYPHSVQQVLRQYPYLWHNPPR
jgi:beta-1,4-mannosyl-glycoprotein beta-1,4-N-acetylglucosaminyltransferase